MVYVYVKFFLQMDCIQYLCIIVLFDAMTSFYQFLLSVLRMANQPIVRLLGMWSLTVGVLLELF